MSLSRRWFKILSLGVTKFVGRKNVCIGMSSEGFYYENPIPDLPREFQMHYGISIEPWFFKRSGTPVRACVRHLINDVFDTDVQRVRSGLTIVWTRNKQEVEQGLLTSLSILPGNKLEYSKLLDVINWVISKPIDIQRKLRYDESARRCVYERRSGRGDVLFQSPQLGKRARRRPFTM